VAVRTDARLRHETDRVGPAQFGEYAHRPETRRDHVLEFQSYCTSGASVSPTGGPVWGVGCLGVGCLGVGCLRVGCLRVGCLSGRAVSGRRGCGLGHGSQRTHRPGDARPLAGERRPASGGRVGADRVGRPCTRAKEDFRNARHWAVRFEAGYAHWIAHGRCRAAPRPLCLAAGRVAAVPWGLSSVPELCGREARPFHGELIFEALKGPG
jgi:hypothetical protein